MVFYVSNKLLDFVFNLVVAYAIRMSEVYISNNSSELEQKELDTFQPRKANGNLMYELLLL